jgi:hypothetical protein
VPGVARVPGLFQPQNAAARNSSSRAPPIELKFSSICWRSYSPPAAVIIGYFISATSNQDWPSNFGCGLLSVLSVVLLHALDNQMAVTARFLIR